MNDNVFAIQWAILINAFPANAAAYGATSQRVYFNDLKEIPDALFVRGCEKIRKDAKRGPFFPSIGELGRASMGYDDWERELIRLRREKQKKLVAPISEEERRANLKKGGELLAKLAREKGVK